MLIVESISFWWVNLHKISRIDFYPYEQHLWMKLFSKFFISEVFFDVVPSLMHLSSNLWSCSMVSFKCECFVYHAFFEPDIDEVFSSSKKIDLWMDFFSRPYISNVIRNVICERLLELSRVKEILNSMFVEYVPKIYLHQVYDRGSVWVRSKLSSQTEYW